MLAIPSTVDNSQTAASSGAAGGRIAPSISPVAMPATPIGARAAMVPRVWASDCGISP